MKTPLERYVQKNSIAITIANTLLYTMLVLEIVVAIPMFAMAAGAFSGRTFSGIVGTSMNPTIHEGDLTMCDTTVSISDLDMGDIIVFEADRAETGTICHRVCDLGDHTVRTRGDHNQHPDPELTTDENLVGRIDLVVPHMGWLVRVTISQILWAVLSVAITVMAIWHVECACYEALDKVWPTYVEFCNRRLAAAQ